MSHGAYPLTKTAIEARMDATWWTAVGATTPYALLSQFC